MDAQGSDGQDNSDADESVASESRPPSHDLRAARVKRLRDGRKKAADRAATAPAPVVEDPVAEALIAAARAQALYYQKKARILDEPDQVSP
jgi:hypothetical protein